MLKKIDEVLPLFIYIRCNFVQGRQLLTVMFVEEIERETLSRPIDLLRLTISSKHTLSHVESERERTDARPTRMDLGECQLVLPSLTPFNRNRRICTFDIWNF